jgi:salicylate hydroxylase
MAAIVVVGAGVGGLAAALALARHGIAAHVMEQAQSCPSGQDLISLSPNAWRALQHLGVAEGLAQEASYPELLAFYDGVSGALLQEAPLALCKKRFGESLAVLPYSRLVDALLQACRAQSLVTLEWGARVEGIGRDNEHDPQAAKILSVQSGERFTDAAAIVGADGALSTVRALTWEASLATPGRLLRWRTQVALGDPSLSGWQPGARVLQWCLPGASVHGLVDTRRQILDIRVHTLGKQTLAHALAATPMRALAVQADRWQQQAWPEQPVVKQWTKGRVTLLGDAAHAALPFLDQGEAMALEDAITLADCVSWAPTAAQAFAAYERLRRPRDRRLQQAASSKASLEMSGGLMRWVRNQVVRKRAAATPIETMAWLYEH